MKKLTLLIIFCLHAMIFCENKYSVVFIIDNSSSNYMTDSEGNRFKVVSQVINQVVQDYPSVNVGLVLFGSRLWFYGPDNENLFSAVPADQFHKGNGCYIPPLDLSKVYSGTAKGFKDGDFTYNSTGKDILAKYLETYPEVDSGGVVNFVTAYTPTHNTPQWTDIKHYFRLTNITRAFDGANQNHLHISANFPKENQFNIFLSDGNAGVEVRSPDKKHDRLFISGLNTPSTFSLCYGFDSISSDIHSMTKNIKNNGYSKNNKKFTLAEYVNDWDRIDERIIEYIRSFLNVKVNTNNIKHDKSLIKINQHSTKKIRMESDHHDFSVDVYSLQGKKIITLKSKKEGTRSCVDWDFSRNVSAGRYLLSIKYGATVENRAIAISQ